MIAPAMTAAESQFGLGLTAAGAQRDDRDGDGGDGEDERRGIIGTSPEAQLLLAPAARLARPR